MPRSGMFEAEAGALVGAVVGFVAAIAAFRTHVYLGEFTQRFDIMLLSGFYALVAGAGITFGMAVGAWLTLRVRQCVGAGETGFLIGIIGTFAGFSAVALSAMISPSSFLITYPAALICTPLAARALAMRIIQPIRRPDAVLPDVEEIGEQRRT